MAERIADDFTAIAQRMREIKDPPPPHVRPPGLEPMPLTQAPKAVRCIRCGDKQVVVRCDGTMDHCPDCSPVYRQQGINQANAQNQQHQQDIADAYTKALGHQGKRRHP